MIDRRSFIGAAGLGIPAGAGRRLRADPLVLGRASRQPSACGTDRRAGWPAVRQHLWCPAVVARDGVLHGQERCHGLAAQAGRLGGPQPDGLTDPAARWEHLRPDRVWRTGPRRLDLSHRHQERAGPGPQFLLWRRCLPGLQPARGQRRPSLRRAALPSATKGAHGGVVQASRDGEAQVLYSFRRKSGGQNPYAGLVEDSTGRLIGVTFTGAPRTGRHGEVYALTPV